MMFSGCLFAAVVLLFVFGLRGNVSAQAVISSDQFPTVPKQLSAKIEMVLTDDKLVEEFFMYWDEELGIVRYDFSLGRMMAPFNSTRPMKVIKDFRNGIAYFIDGTMTNCSMYPLGYLRADANSTTSTGQNFFKARRYINVGNLTLHHLLRAIHPKQMFYMDGATRVVNSTMEIVRGIPCEVWNLTVDNYYIPGYGLALTKHRMYFMAKDFARFLVGEVPYRIPVQRVVTLVNWRVQIFQSPRTRVNMGSLVSAGYAQAVSTDKIIFNFFDFTVPLVPTVYDFSISSCIPKGKLETRESIQIRFPGNFSTMRADQFILPFRRKVLQRILDVGEISPLRAVGMYFSQDANNMYITATILPRTPALLHYTLTNSGQMVSLPRLAGGPLADLMSQNLQLGSCATSCIKMIPDCGRFAWCSRMDVSMSTITVMRRCVLSFDMDSYVNQSAVILGGRTSDMYSCEVYQKIMNTTAYDGGVVETLFKILVDVQEGNFTVTVDSNTTSVTAVAEDMRTDVSLHEDTANPSTGTDSRTSFDFYRAHAMIINSGVRDQFSKLSPAECRQHCLDEKRFTCQSVGSCAYGDCIISDLHGDELLNDTNGKPNINTHSHCAIWTRTWKGMFTLASLLVPKTPPDLVISSVSNEDTCAKQCLFGNLSCESFSFCSQLNPLAGTSKRPGGSSKYQHECQLYKSHAFDVMNDDSTRVYKPGCWHLSRNYVNDFEASPGFELFGVGDSEFIEREIEPSLERWHCAKECIDMLGDDGCLAFDVCEDIQQHTEDLLNGDLNSTSSSSYSPVKCRISSQYIAPGLYNTSQKVRANENCTLFTRKTYLDGTTINPKTVAATKREATLQQGYNFSIPLEHQAQAMLFARNGYSVSDMTGVGIGMLAFGIVATSVCFVLWRHRPATGAAGGVSFMRDIPFVRFS